ncbi:glucose-6-phosphate dehydrogenase [Wangella sp. NEAU-J3]|nr:glucose-6-phosphate dehydrogenase [Jidongwangia harbinensis]MCA2219435.1 glucose-6-phosphate dehydrogenase [Jidongwangia harbinensis]
MRGAESRSAAGGQTLLVLGASGDLTGRLLLPGLGGLLAGGTGGGLFLVGSGIDDWSDARWRQRVTESFAAAAATGAQVTATTDSALYLRADVTRPEDLRGLLAACRGPVVIFFALPPAITAKACRALTEVELPTGTRLVLEKPFGTDTAGAAQLNELLATLVPEEQIHRVDHFLGKSTVLNILGLRFANRLFEPVLNAEHVAAVDIVFDESLALEGRAGYYDSAGALIDMVQSHLLQVLALLTMDAPPTVDARELRDRKAQMLRATRLWDDDVRACTRRARYTAGEIAGRRVPDYADEAGVDAARSTETLAEVVLTVDTWRWAGVPFRLRSGKAMSATRKEAVITFKQPARVPDGLTGYDRPDRLRIGFGPDRLAMDVNINGPGDPFRIDPVTLGVDFGPGELPAYGEVLRGVLDDDPTLSVRGDTAEQCWRIVEPVLSAWREETVPLLEYPAGSGGPEDSLLAKQLPFPAPGTDPRAGA